MAITNTVPTQPFVSTYAVLTAKRILELFKISLSDAEVRAAIQSRDTFYKHILTTYAVILSGYLSLGSAADLKDFCDQQLWDIEARKIEEQARVDVENVSPSTQSNTELLAVHDGFSDLKSHLENIQDALDKETALIDDIIGKQLSAWKQLQETHADDKAFIEAAKAEIKPHLDIIRRSMGDINQLGEEKFKQLVKDIENYLETYHIPQRSEMTPIGKEVIPAPDFTPATLAH